MASLRDTQELTREFEHLIRKIRSELDGDVDFERRVSDCEEKRERAGAIAQTFSTVNTVLVEQVERSSMEISRRAGRASRRLDRGASAEAGR